MDNETRAKYIDAMQAAETVIHEAESKIRGPITALREDVTELQQGQREQAEWLKHIDSSVKHNTQELRSITNLTESLLEGQAEATEVNRQILTVAEKFQAVGTVASMIGGFIPWLTKTNTGRGFAIIAIVIVMAFHDEWAIKMLDKLGL